MSKGKKKVCVAKVEGMEVGGDAGGVRKAKKKKKFMQILVDYK